MHACGAEDRRERRHCPRGEGERQADLLAYRICSVLRMPQDAQPLSTHMRVTPVH